MNKIFAINIDGHMKEQSRRNKVCDFINRKSKSKIENPP